ncbi:MAG TPA: TraB/GumN family protein, partial [Puia sp.]|nr:TraB/GumN family protein [Puia sp.]
EIQAASIDSIVKRHSLFVGVGAAHLPGKRGVIELLRKKGYTLRPVMMPDQDATRRDDIDRIKVPVSFAPFNAPDGSFSVQLPGKLYRRTDNRFSDSWQYADMSNGAYYMIERLHTHAAFLGQKDEALLKKVDSLLYESVPGKILKKTPISRNGCRGFDITARTRRGDIQRYNILVTPHEVWVFKMSGTNNYVEGPEAEQFFGSINVRHNPAAGWTGFTPARGGFTIRWPRTPAESREVPEPDGVARWEYEAADSLTGDSYLLWRSTIQNYRFMEEDTADLGLMEQSFRSSEYIDRCLSRRPGRFDNHACIDATYQARDGSFIRAKFILHGADYYVLAAHSRGKEKNFTGFFGSFTFTPYKYPHFRNYVDSFLHISVTTPMVPDVDAGMRRIVERASSQEFLNSIPDYNNYWPRPKTALFQDDSTGEAVFVSVESFPKYYYPKDTASFWQEETSEKRLRDLVVSGKHPYRDGDRFGYRYTLTDTNTTRKIDIWLFLDDNHLFRVVSLTDSLQDSSEFIDRFYSTLKPIGLSSSGPSVFASKLDTFFHDFYSNDSAVAKKAKEAIPNVYFGPAGVPALLNVIDNLPYNDKDYFETKTKFINELGFIKDSAAIPAVVAGLEQIYRKAGDTSILQNAVFKALARHKTKAAYQLLAKLMIQDPPVFDNSTDYSYLFRDIGDSLALARTLFPGLMQLAAVDDYKPNIQSLLADLVDSSYLQAADYEPWFSQIYFDARIAWKKQEGKDEKKLQKKADDNDDNDADDDGNSGNELDDYAILLLPFYGRNPAIPHFFDRLLQSRDPGLRLSTTLLLIRHHRNVPDSILQALAAGDVTRGALYQGLADIGQLDLFPRKYRNQESIARSLLVASHGTDDFAGIVLVDKSPAQFKQTKGTVYFFKYKINKEDSWQMGLSGIQPENRKDISTDGSLVILTGKKLHSDIPEIQQFQEQWRRVVLSRRKSAASFFQDNDYGIRQDED